MLSHKARTQLWRFVAANNLSFTIKKCCGYCPQQTVISSAANSLFMTLRMLCHMAITNFGFKSKFNEKQSEMICWADVVLSKAAIFTQDNAQCAQIAKKWNLAFLELQLTYDSDWGLVKIVFGVLFSWKRDFFKFSIFGDAGLNFSFRPIYMKFSISL